MSAREIEKLVRPIIGIENRTAQEAFDIMADRIRSHFAADEGPGWRTITEADRTIPIIVGCWVVTDGEPNYWSAWTVWPGDDLGCDGAWGDEPTHWMPLPAAPAPDAKEG